MAFYGCTKLKSVTFPNATMVPFGLFRESGLESFNGPNVEMLGSYVFLNCTALTNLYLPKVRDIGAEAFRGCTTLVEVSLPSIEHFGANPFPQCTSLMSIEYSGDCPTIDLGVAGYALTSDTIRHTTNYVNNSIATGWGKEF